MEDKFTKPNYYVSGRNFEPKDVIMYANCDFFIGNVIKYISRAGRKPGSSFIDDISKAAVYVGFEIDKLNPDYNHGWYAARLDRSYYTDLYWKAVIEDWGFDESNNIESKLGKEVMEGIYSYLIEYNFDSARSKLKCVQASINRYISDNKVTAKSNPSSDISKDYKNGWNDAIEEPMHVASNNHNEDDLIYYKDGWNAALEEVIEYLHSAHGGDTFVSKSELIGHCEASKKP